jgi:hypothetical protein
MIAPSRGSTVEPRLRGSATAAARAAILAVLLAAALLPFGRAQARSSISPASVINVDVTPLLAKGLSGYAQIVRDDLRQALETEFAGRLRPGERLVMVAQGISLASYVGGMDLLFPDRDFLDGVVTLFDAHGQPLTSRKLLVQSPASAGGAWYIRGGELRRTAVLSRVFASWARRYLSG